VNTGDDELSDMRVVGNQGIPTTRISLNLSPPVFRELEAEDESIPTTSRVVKENKSSEEPFFFYYSGSSRLRMRAYQQLSG